MTWRQEVEDPEDRPPTPPSSLRREEEFLENEVEDASSGGRGRCEGTSVAPGTSAPLTFAAVAAEMRALSLATASRMRASSRS